MKDSPDTKKYDKIKHLVEVDDDILAVFSIESSVLKELYIAKNANIDKNYIETLIRILGLIRTSDSERLQTHSIKQETDEAAQYDNILGKIKWVVMEYHKIRILKIFEENKTIFVLIKSNTQLEHTVDNILGYYYDLDETPRSLF
ncbi:MAG TPA: hypothetical protein VD815_06645 [Candidatus Saccharimonadales bacterium]|nr:hypothetical protein [Candidatus Saccharimonadales bacterium]